MGAQGTSLTALMAICLPGHVNGTAQRSGFTRCWFTLMCPASPFETLFETIL